MQNTSHTDHNGMAKVLLVYLALLSGGIIAYTLQSLAEELLLQHALLLFHCSYQGYGLSFSLFCLVSSPSCSRVRVFASCFLNSAYFCFVFPYCYSNAYCRTNVCKQQSLHFHQSNNIFQPFWHDYFFIYLFFNHFFPNRL